MKRVNALLVMVLAAVLVAGLSIGALAWNDGTYKGTADGHNGPLTVEVTVEDGKITSIAVVEHSETPGLFELGSGVAEAIISTQSLAVDTVSGATVTSRAVITAVRNAVGFKDGTYTGKGKGFMDDIAVEVVVKGGKIAAINVLSHSETPGISDAAFTSVPEAIIAAQSVDVDTATGATGTSKGIIAAVKDALGM